MEKATLVLCRPPNFSTSNTDTMTRWIVFLLPLLLLASCTSYTPFTERLYAEYDWTERELKRIQFYLSKDLVLRRELSGSQSRIERGEIKVVDGRRVEEIVFRKNTPGLVLFSPKPNRLAVSFEERDNDRYLMFGPNPREDGQYVLLASDWKRDYGTVTYDGRAYYVDARQAMAGLKVDLKKIEDVRVKSRRAKGRRVD